MAAKKDNKKPAEKKRHVTSKKWEKYKGSEKTNKFCPKCGPGVFMANHKDRETCGKCGYMVKKSSEKKEE